MKSPSVTAQGADLIASPAIAGCALALHGGAGERCRTRCGAGQREQRPARDLQQLRHELAKQNEAELNAIRAASIAPCRHDSDATISACREPEAIIRPGADHPAPGTPEHYRWGHRGCGHDNPAHGVPASTINPDRPRRVAFPASASPRQSVASKRADFDALSGRSSVRRAAGECSGSASEQRDTPRLKVVEAKIFQRLKRPAAEAGRVG